MGNVFETPDLTLWHAMGDSTSDRALGLIQGRLDANEDKAFVNFKHERVTLLQRSITKKHFDVSKRLLELDASIDVEYTTIYHLIAEHGTLEFLEYVVAQPWYTNGFVAPMSSPKNFEKPLYSATRANNKPLIERILDMDPEAINKSVHSSSGMHPLHIAARFSTLETFLYLLSRGAKIAATSHSGANCLMIAIQHNNYCIADYLIINHRELIPMQRLDGFNALHMSVYSKIPNLTQTLLDTRLLNINAVDKNGNTALMHAAGQNAVFHVQILVSAGANKDIINMGDMTAMKIAQSQKFEECVLLLK